MENPMSKEVIIIGSGAAGIGAAVTLSRNEFTSFVILEARDRMGGRMNSTFVDGVQIDLGASWIHTYNPENAMGKQISRFNWKERESKYSKQYEYASEINGGLFSPQTIKQCTEIHDGYFNEVAKQAAESKQDISILQAGKNFYKKHIAPLSKDVKSLVDNMIHKTQRFEAAPLEELSAKYYDEEEDEGEDLSPEKSYYSLLMKIAESEKIQEKVIFNTEVLQINYEGPLCRVTCSDGKVYTSKRVISSLPLGILKKGVVKFSPQLPESHSTLIKNIGFGVMNKIIVSFDKPFWIENPSWLIIACEERGKYPALYNFSTADKHILCCFVTDDFAKKISQQSDEEIIGQLRKVLCRSYNLSELKPTDFAITRWDQEKYSLGSYSHFDLETNIVRTNVLRENVDGKLWIVGEHCYGEMLGCAHGAFFTGKNAAKEILKR